MPTESFIILAVFAVLVIVVYAIYRFRTRKKRKEKLKNAKIKRKVNNLSKTKVEMSPSEFIALRAQTFGGRGSRLHDKLNFEGVYVLFNRKKTNITSGRANKFWTE